MAIAFVGGATNGSSTAVTTLSVTYSPAAGNTVIVSISTGGAPGAGSCSDSNSASLTQGPSIANTDTVVMFYYTAGSGVTSLTANWTTARIANISVVEYSGVGSVNAALAGNTASGTSAAPSITVTTQDNNDWVVASFVTVLQTMTTTTGTQREQVAIGGNPRLTTADNTVATAGSVTIAGTITSAAWAVALIELRTVSAAAGPSNWLGKQVATGINKH